MHACSTQYNLSWYGFAHGWDCHCSSMDSGKTLSLTSWARWPSELLICNRANRGFHCHETDNSVCNKTTLRKAKRQICLDEESVCLVVGMCHVVVHIPRFTLLDLKPRPVTRPVRRTRPAHQTHHPKRVPPPAKSTEPDPKAKKKGHERMPRTESQQGPIRRAAVRSPEELRPGRAQ